MSTGSKIALASAAGVVAATAAGLATTKTGRRMVRQAKKSMAPMINERISTVMETVETSLEDHGLLQLIPASVRSSIRDRLTQLTGTRKGQHSSGVRSGSSTVATSAGNGHSAKYSPGRKSGRRGTKHRSS